MPADATRLCEVCNKLVIRAFLLAAEAAPSKPNINKRGLLTSSKKGIIHDAVPIFFEHQPNLLTLKNVAESCDLCEATWKQYCQQRQPFELTEVALSDGLGNEHIYIGTLDWDTGLNAVPHVVASQQILYGSGARSSRQLACFEVCAEHGSQSDIVPQSHVVC